MSALGVNGWTLAVQLLAFLVFIGLFWRFALGPITRMLDTRQERIRDSMEAAQRIERDLAATQARNEEVLVEARREAQQIIAAARESGEQLVARAQGQAQAQAEEFLTKARATLQAEQQQAWLQLRRDVADLAIAAATKIVRKELDRQEQTKLIEETLAEAGDGRLQA